MADTKYDRIPNDDPNENINLTPTKNSAADPTLLDLNREEDLLLYDKRSSKKTKQPNTKGYKVVRVFTLGLIIALIISLVSVSVYMCLTCDCISRSYRDLCEEGFCYDIAVDTFQDSNNDGTGDFIGIKNSLKFLREIGIQTIIIPLSSFSKTQPFHDVQSFTEMIKQGRKVGISTIVRLDESSPKEEHFNLVNEISPSVSGFILTKNSPYFKKENIFSNKKCYISVSSLNDVNVVVNGCAGTFYEPKDNLFNFGSETIDTLRGSCYTNSSVNILSLKAIDLKLPTKNTQFLASLIFMGLTNGSMTIKAGDEIGYPLNANYSGQLNSSDPFQSDSIPLMKNIKVHRQYTPKIGSMCDLHHINVAEDSSIKIISKICTTRDIPEMFAMIWNQGITNATISVEKTFVLQNSSFKSANILIKANSPISYLDPSTNELTLEPSAIILLDVKFRPFKSV